MSNLFQDAGDQRLKEVLDACGGDVELAVEYMMADAAIARGEVGPKSSAPTDGQLPILEGLLEVPVADALASASAGNEGGPKFVDPSSSYLLSSSSTALRTQLLQLVDCDTSDTDRSMYAARYEDRCPDPCHVPTMHKQKALTQFMAELMGYEDEAIHTARSVSNERLVLEMGTRAVLEMPKVKKTEEHRRAPGRTEHDPVPVKVTPEALTQLRGDVLPFLIQRIEALKLPAQELLLDVPLLGEIKIKYSNVQVEIKYTDESKSDLKVGCNGIKIKVANVEAHIEGAEWSYEQTSFPFLHGNGTLEASALGGDVTMLMRCTELQPGVGRTLVIDPDLVNIGRMVITIDGSWSSWLYNMIITMVKPQIKASIETTIHGILEQAADSINDSMEWVAVLVLAVMQAEEDELAEANMLGRRSCY